MPASLRPVTRSLGVNEAAVELALERSAVLRGAAGGAGEAVQVGYELLALLHQLLVVGQVLWVFGIVSRGFVALHAVVDEQGQLVERVGQFGVCRHRLKEVDG